MTFKNRENDLKTAYFEWLYQLVCDDKYRKNVSYERLFLKLHNTPFSFSLYMDGNRAADGIDLRYRFGYENGYSQDLISEYLDDEACSVLEMMVALSLRCEEHIMSNSNIGNRTGQWFWNMVVNLGLGSMSDWHYDEDYVSKTIDRFLNREYEPNGIGGLFHVDTGRDLRKVDIWYQMMWYLNDNYKTE